MTRYLAFLVLALLWLQAPAWAAGATVLDPDDLIPVSAEAGLLRELDKLGSHRAVVVYMKRGASDGVEAIAERTFDSNYLDRDDLCVAVDIAGRKVAAHVGQDLTDRGLSGDAISGVIAQTFKEPARAGQFDQAALALAKGLADFNPAAPPPAAGGQAPASSGGDWGIEWWMWLFIPVFIYVMIFGKSTGSSDHCDDDHDRWSSSSSSDSSSSSSDSSSSGSTGSGSW